MDFEGKRVTVMGLGRFGGGVGVARFLRDRGAVVTVTDHDTAENLAGSVAAVGGGVVYHLGEHRPEDFADTDLVVVNPAVRPDSPYLRIAAERGVPIETEINLFFRLCPARILGVTGSVGKTTTVSMIGRALAKPGVWVGGNIGRSLLNDLDRITAADLVVLELSSAQLYRLAPTGLAPHVAVVTNLSENHLDWHRTMTEYTAAKRSIIGNQPPDGVAVLNRDDPVVRGWARDCKAQVIFFSAEPQTDGVFVRDRMIIARLRGREEAVLDTRSMRLPGEHNVGNALAAVAACAAVGADLAQVGRRVLAFEGAEHRLEFVREVRGVRFYNDSKATTPVASMAALSSFDVSRIVLILGGRDKEMTYDRLADAAAGCRAVVLVGEMAGRLDNLLQTRAPAQTRTTATTMAGAVRAGARLARPGDVVLLSPACTSYDMFQNFEHRGRAFKDAVASLEAQSDERLMAPVAAP